MDGFVYDPEKPYERRSQEPASSARNVWKDVNPRPIASPCDDPIANELCECWGDLVAAIAGEQNASDCGLSTSSNSMLGGAFCRLGLAVAGSRCPGS